MILLKNEDNLLPLDESKLRKVAVVGFQADSQIDCGAAVVVGVPAYAVTPLEGLKERLGEERVVYAPGPFAERTIPNFISQFIADFGFEAPKPQTFEEQTAAIEEAVRAAEESDVVTDKKEIGIGETLTVSVDVTNTSGRDGCTVAQLYVHQRWGSDSRPIRELKGFDKVLISAGETKTVTFELGPDELTYYSTAKRAYVQDAADFDLWVGNDSTAELHTEFTATEA